MQNTQEIYVEGLTINKDLEAIRLTLDSIGDGVIVTDSLGAVQYLNPAATTLTGWSDEEAKQQPIEEVFPVLRARHPHLTTNPVLRCIQEDCPVRIDGHVKLVNYHGQQLNIEANASPIRSRTSQSVLGAVMVFRAASAMKLLTDQLAYQATHDALTGLVNRSEFERCLQKILNNCEQHGEQHVLLYMDLDSFKVVNDRAGYIAGDQLLRQISELFVKQIREQDTLARLDGDEFGVLLRNCQLEDAKRVAEAMIKAAEEFHFEYKTEVFRVGLSIGIASINSENKELASLLSAADLACSIAKDRGRNNYRIYCGQDDTLIQRNDELLWLTQLHNAVEKDHFELFFQPIKPLDSTQKRHHIEILVRLFDHKKNTLISPTLFIPTAERFKLMHEIDRLVVNKTLTWLDEHRQALDQLEMISINLSGNSISDESSLNLLAAQIAESDVPSEKLCFEITETAAISNIHAATRFINLLKQLGCSFALDDFGAGMSSFAYLKNLPVDYLKIDGMFIKGITHDAIDMALVNSINEIGHVMGLKTIAEFVENNSILSTLHDIGVDYVQGYAIAEPRPLSELSL